MKKWKRIGLVGFIPPILALASLTLGYPQISLVFIGVGIPILCAEWYYFGKNE